MAAIDYIGGWLTHIAADMDRLGFARIGEHVWQKGNRRIRWVSGDERLRGIDGVGKKFIVRPDCSPALRQQAAAQRFELTYSIE